ncbi:MAG: aminomethyl-transferring glycine dehydrogenase subunit GcvPB [Calditrichaeota bacterium]|nr:aminomethyl-transferring glycine dehydrogenase subunit GcvPB [Calditrichota bacterium]MBT7788121.1 aminomethyl-transferring glycine dehydrogenase subunit GcvPB [Calditrichota bacterium]
MSIPLIFESDRPALSCGYSPHDDLPAEIKGPPAHLLRDELDLPQVAEPAVMRHFVNLSTLNHHVDKGFYPLGSCTMKYNPKINEALAGLPGLAGLHPHQPVETIQGALELMYKLEKFLCEITGMPAMTLQPAAGAHGELTGMFVARAYHESNGNPRKIVLTPDSSHGTNPASIVMAGYTPASIPSKSDGRIDLEGLKEALNDDVAALMVTNPNTLGLFEDEIDEVAAAVHEAGALLYMDGANMNALMGLSRPGDMGFDIVHLNLHKTFSTPHGGGGPGSGPVGVVSSLEPYLPRPRVIREADGKYNFDWDRPKSIGKVHSHFGNFGMLIRAMAYIRALGPDGLKKASELAVLNANYIRHSLEGKYKLPFDGVSMHEVVFSADNQNTHGLKAVDIAKRLLDFDIHAPTVNFPLIVHEALMIEPTETESLETLDRFIEVMLQIDEEAQNDPDRLREAPLSTPVCRMNEVLAARKMDIVYKPE